MMNVFEKMSLTGLILTVLMVSVSAQSLSNLSLELGIPNSYDAFVVAPTAQFESNKHVWSIGPTVLLSYGDQVEQRESMKLSGLYLGYTNFPQGSDQMVSLFYEFNLWLQRIKVEQDSRYFNTQSGSFDDFTIEQIDNTIQFFASLGIQFQLSDKIAVRQTIGTGINSTFRSATSPFTDFSDPFVKQDWLLKTSFVYRLN